MMLRSKGILTQLMPTNCSDAKQLPQFCIIIKSQKNSWDIYASYGAKYSNCFFICLLLQCHFLQLLLITLSSFRRNLQHIHCFVSSLSKLPHHHLNADREATAFMSK